MNDIKKIKKIFNLTHYDFINNLHSWLSITGLQAIIYIIFFIGICAVLNNFDMSYWESIPNLLFDWQDKLYELFYCHQVDSFYQMKIFCLDLFLIQFFLFPVVVLENALDLAFDSLMRGMSIRLIPVHYIIGLTLALIFVLAIYQFVRLSIMHGCMYLVYNKGLLILCKIFCNDFFIYFGYGLQIFLYAYLLQLLYIFVMHLLEYKKNIIISGKEFYEMIQGKKIFLIKILVLQLVITVISLTFFYFFLGFIIKIIMPFFTLIFKLLSISVAPAFIFMMSNFFYTWAYLLLFSWISLFTAHIYRQLVCPPIDNLACLSCTSCKN